MSHPITVLPTFEFTTALLMDAAVKGVAVLLLAALGVFTLRKQAAAWRHLVWSLATVGLVALPILSTCLPAWQIPLPAALRVSLPTSEATVAAVETPADTVTVPDGLPVENSALEASQSPRNVVPTPTANNVTTVPPAPLETPITSPPPVVSSSESNSEGEPEPAIATASTIETPRALDSTSPVATARLPWIPWLACVWLGGVLLVLLVPLVGLFQVVRLQRSGRAFTDDSWNALLNDITRELHIRRRVRLMCSAKSRMPLTWGVLRPVVLLPEEANAWETPRRRMVLLHELAHVKRLDWLTQMVGQLATALHWFNPLVWFVNRWMQIDREQACDDMVLRAGTSQKEYALELLHFATQLRTRSLCALAAVPMARKTSLEQRIRGIMDGTRRRVPVTRITMLCGLVIGACVLIPLAMMQALADEDKPKEPTETVRVATPELIKIEGLSAFVVVEKDETAYAFLYAGDIDAETSFTSNSKEQSWQEQGTLTAGKVSIPFQRKFNTPGVLQTDQTTNWNLKAGRVFVIDPAEDQPYQLKQVDAEIPLITEQNIKDVFAQVQPVETGNGEAIALRTQNTVELLNGIKVTLKSEVFHGADVMTTGLLQWPATQDRQALQYEFHVAADAFAVREPWAVAWEKGTSRLWIAHRGIGQKYPNLRTIDFSNPERILTWTHYGSDKFKTSEPNDPVVNARREPVSIADPPPRVPRDVMNTLTEQMPDVKELKLNGPLASGKHIDAASLDETFIIRGSVRDLQGRPLTDIPIEVTTEFHPTVKVETTRTGHDGRYELKFRMDLRTLKQWRGLIVRPRIAGLTDDNFGRAGEFTMRLHKEEKVRNSFSENTVIVGQPATADFLMQPTATIEGRILDIDEAPWSNTYLAVKYKGQRKGYSLVSTSTDNDGRFRLTDVPTNKELVLITSQPGLHETIVLGNFTAKRTRMSQTMAVTRTVNGWRIVQQTENVSVRVRVIEQQDEIAPPADAEAFAQKVIAWAESCRISKPKVMELNPKVWEGVLAGYSLVHVKFTRPRVIALSPLGPTAIDEIAFALPQTGPGGLFLKSGQHTFCLDHWTLDAFRPVIAEPALRTTRMKWYKRLLDATAAQPQPEKTAVVTVDREGKLHFQGKPVALKALVKTLSDAGHNAKETTVILMASKETKVAALHWPLWQLSSSNWKKVQIKVATEEKKKQTVASNSPTVRGLNLAIYPGTRDNGKIVELTEPVPDSPGERRHSDKVFVMTIQQTPTEAGIYYAPHHQVYYITIQEPDRHLRFYGPIKGDPFEQLKLQEVLQAMPVANRVLTLRRMVRSEDDRLRQRAFELIPELPQRRFRRTYESLQEDVEQALIRYPNAPSANAARVAHQWLLDDDQAWHNRRIEIPDNQYTPGEPSTTGEKIVWSETNKAGLRIGYGVPLSNRWQFGETVELDLWVENAGSKPVKLTYTPRMDEGVTVWMTPVGGEPIAWKMIPFSTPIFGNRVRLEPNTRVKVKTVSFTLQAADEEAKEKNSPAEWITKFQLPEGRYQMKAEVRLPGYERLGRDGQVSVPAAGEWIGTLTTKPHNVILTSPPSSEDKPEAKPPAQPPELPEAKLKSTDDYSLFTIQTKTKVHLAFYSTDKIESEIQQKTADGQRTFFGSLYLIRDGKRARRFHLNYSTATSELFTLDQQKHTLSRPVSELKKGVLRWSGNLIALTQDLPPLETHRTISPPTAKDFQSMHKQVSQDVFLARHYRYNRELERMNGWVMSWDDQHMIQHSDGAHVAQMRIFPDGRVVVADRQRGLLTLKLSKPEFDKVMADLLQHPAIEKLPKPKPLPKDSKDILILSPIRGGHWDQNSSSILLKDKGERYSLFWLSKSRDGRPQTGMSDEEWQGISEKLYKLMDRVRKARQN